MSKEKNSMIARRLDLARNHYLAASKLAQLMPSNGDYGPSSSHLSVLSFELLLKAVALADSDRIIGSHNYESIWGKLRLSTQKELLDYATNRFAGHVDFSSPGTLLAAWQKNFEQGRYSYEINEKRSEEEIVKVTNDWDGCPESADFAYYPLELDGLTEAMLEWLERYLDE